MENKDILGNTIKKRNEEEEGTLLKKKRKREKGGTLYVHKKYPRGTTGRKRKTATPIATEREKKNQLFVVFVISKIQQRITLPLQQGFRPLQKVLVRISFNFSQKAL